MTTLAASPEPSALATLLADPDRLRDFPIEAVERLFVLDRQIRADAARQEFYRDFNLVQGALSPVRKLGWNSQTSSHYARLEDVTRMLDPIMLEKGFSRSLSTEPSNKDEHIIFVLTLRHIGGHEERHRLEAPLDYLGPKGQANKTKIHGMASSYTICERQLLTKVWGLETFSDDDGNAAGGIGPGSETISDAEASDLEALIDEVNADRRRLYAICGIGAVSDLKKSQLKSTLALLEAKRAQR